MVDNTLLIRNLLHFDKEGDFFFGEILKRRKDNPDMKKHVKILHYYYIDSYEMYDDVLGEIKDRCAHHNARFYLYLNCRNFKRVGLETLKLVTDAVIKEDYKYIRRAYHSACGSCHSDSKKTWVVDVDDTGLISQDIILTISKLQEEVGKDSEISVVPTSSGYHFISSPFNLQKFKQEWSKIDVFKDAPTLVYKP